MFEAGLVSTIISDVADQPGTLPLLQYTLTELFERRVGRMLTMESYQGIGGVLGALGERAEENILAGLDGSQPACCPPDVLTSDHPRRGHGGYPQKGAADRELKDYVGIRV